MGEISKQVFKHFAEFECDRQLFIDLGESDPRWIAPLREIVALPHPMGGSRLGLTELGRDYERAVYDMLTRNVHARFRRSTSPDAPVAPAPLDRALLDALYLELAAAPRPIERYLLEHEWSTPLRFLEFAFGVVEDELPVSKAPGGLRPDILVVGDACTEPEPRPLWEVLPDGTLRALSNDERAKRFGIRVLDIKHTHEQGVGRGHLIELIYYAIALSCELDRLSLRDRFFVGADGHGIVPKRDVTTLATLIAGRPQEIVVPLAWRDTYHLFEAVRRRVRALRESAPRAIESVEARIQPACGRCPYLEDCKRSLQPSGEAESWDLALIPYLRQGSAEQLRAMGFRTIGDVASRVREIPVGMTPQPIYAEVAPLELKARALVQQRELPALPENTAGQRMLSLALPRFTNIDLFFDVETDPTNEVVFALALYLEIRCAPDALFAAQHDAWWRYWRAWLDAERSDPDVHAIDALLDSKLIGGGFVSDNPAQRQRDYRLFGKALRELRETSGGKLSITLAGETLNERTLERARLSYQFAYVNSGARGVRGYEDGERVVAERAVTQLFNLLLVAQCYEEYARAVQVVTDRGEARSWTAGPAFAAFYWSREQLEHIQDLLERHLPGLVGHSELRERFLSLIEWLAPSESSVAHFLQHLKVFDLREFVESSVGIPEIINATWHGIDARIPRDSPVTHSRRYWAPHFNYMDFAVWHEYVNEPDANRQVELRDGIARELRSKLWALQRILRHYRAQAGDVIAQTRSKPAKTGELKQKTLPASMHALAQVWYLYSRLNAAMQDLEAEYIRTTYPTQSIASLVAAEVSDIDVDLGRETIALRVRGLSTNAKFAEGDYVFLLPESARDAAPHVLKNYQAILDEMLWDAETQSFVMKLSSTAQTTHVLLASGAPDSDWVAPSLEQPWFLYGAPSDAWSARLLKLLKREQIGDSWLGRRLALLWSVGNDTEIDEPAHRTVRAPEVYLFAPQLLPSVDEDPSPLRTTQHPPPDPSQSAAIRFALSRTISCIQGPPGTGKSQTIAALIDEFLRRREGPARVLVTAFSYSALSVVLDKLRDARGPDGRPTLASQTQLVWLRSSGREPIADEPGRPHVFDLTIESTKMTLDGKSLARHGGKRLDSYLADRFILFANAYSLAKLSEPSSSKKFDYELLSNGFGFDLIIVDEASQLPANQLLASAALVRPFESSVRLGDVALSDVSWPLSDLDRLSQVALETTPAFKSLTRYVIVGDHNQLPPVQAVKPPAKLRRVLDSAFHYYVLGHGVEHRQLQRNYRSRPTIVEYTRRLELYEAGLEAFREEHPYPSLPPPREDEPAWVRAVLADDKVVGTIIHGRRHETAVSPLEAKLAADLAVAFYRQMGVSSERDERTFWQEHLGIVAPHNAQGRLIARAIYDRLTAAGERRMTRLSDRDLMTALRATIYSVEKFQGSDRTFIIGSMALSSSDQLVAEEAFIYDINRFNVLTSRAKQKMLLLCSERFLEYIPRDREVFAFAARVRQFAYGFCDVEQALSVQNELGALEEPAVRWRYRSG